MPEVCKEKVRISLICNGPSSDHQVVREWGALGPAPFESVFRVNHWYLNDGGAFGPHCTDWFIGEHSEIVHTAAAYRLNRPPEDLPALWFPGLSGDAIELAQRQLKGYTISIQKHYHNLPALCRWDADPRPRRPLMGSLALAVAVARQPEELYMAGMDLYQHERGKYLSTLTPPDHTETFLDEYLGNTHGNHALLADLRYIRNALDAFSGKVFCVSSTMKKYFADDYKQWEWIDG